jgi:hypothetical protein
MTRPHPNGQTNTSRLVRALSWSFSGIIGAVLVTLLVSQLNSEPSVGEAEGRSKTSSSEPSDGEAEGSSSTSSSEPSDGEAEGSSSTSITALPPFPAVPFAADEGLRMYPLNEVPFERTVHVDGGASLDVVFQASDRGSEPGFEGGQPLDGDPLFAVSVESTEPCLAFAVIAPGERVVGRTVTGNTLHIPATPDTSMHVRLWRPNSEVGLDATVRVILTVGPVPPDEANEARRAACYSTP